MIDKFDMTMEENIFCAKRILVDSIYKQANLENIAVTFAQTQDILNNVNVESLTPNEINKVCCLRDGWNYLLENIERTLDLAFLEEIHELIARFDVDYRYLGKVRVDEVMISGTTWRPEIPNIDEVYNELTELLKINNVTEQALKVGFWIMKTQLFKDGNKRVAAFAINKILIKNGKGIFNVPVKEDGTFKSLLINYYETNDVEDLLNWSYDNCLDGINKVQSKEIEPPVKHKSR